MNEWDIAIWLPFVVISIADIVWYSSLNKRQKKNNDLTFTKKWTMEMLHVSMIYLQGNTM